MALRLFGLVAGVAVLAVTAISPAAGALLENSTIPLSFTSDSVCTGEAVAFEGTLHVVESETVNSGGTHRTGHVTGQLDGIGLLSGAKYVGTINEEVAGMFATPPRESSNSTIVSNVRIVRTGESAPADDYSERILTRLTIDANGEERAFVDTYVAGCG